MALLGLEGALKHYTLCVKQSSSAVNCSIGISINMEKHFPVWVLLH
jgi:hypothetical protein